MIEEPWENFIALNNQTEAVAEHIGPVSNYLGQDDFSVAWGRESLPMATAAARDTSPLPRTEDREGYYGPNHFNYWASGLRDYRQMLDWCVSEGREIESYMDMGCASGRVLRHFYHQGHGARLLGCDINRKHIDWVNMLLPPKIEVFQNTSIPHLPLPDGCVDFISAFSVFTHIECFDTTWLMELRRILRPGGIAWVTIHSERVWRELEKDWPLYAALGPREDYQQMSASKKLPGDRLVFRWLANKSYTSNVFYSDNYIKTHWGRIFELVDIIEAKPKFQDIAILRKA